MIVDWHMPGTASRRMIDVVRPAAHVQGYYTAAIRRSFDGSPPNATRVRMTGRIAGATFDIAKRLDHARRPPTAGTIAVVPVFPASRGFAEDGQMAFDVAASSHYVIGSNVTIPAVVTSHDESMKEVLVIDATCSVTRHDDEPSSAAATDNVIIDDGCSVSVDRVNGSLSLSLPSSDFSRGRYNVHVQARYAASDGKLHAITGTSTFQIISEELTAKPVTRKRTSYYVNETVELKVKTQPSPAQPNKSKLQVTWSCSSAHRRSPRQRRNTHELSECFVDGASYYVKDDALTFSASMLSIASTPASFYFYVQASSEDGRNVVQVLPVTVERGDRPAVSVRCLANCPASNGSRVVDVASALVLVADCDNCGAGERLDYRWTVDVLNMTRLSAAMPYGRHARRFALNIRSLNRSSPFHTVHVTVTRMDTQKASVNFTVQLPEDYMDFAARLQLEAIRNSQKIPADSRSLSGENTSTSTDTVSSLWWLMLLLLVVVPVPVVVTVVIWKKNVNRQRQVYGMADQRQPEDRTSANMTDSNN